GPSEARSAPGPGAHAHRAARPRPFPADAARSDEAPAPGTPGCRRQQRRPAPRRPTTRSGSLELCCYRLPGFKRFHPGILGFLAELFLDAEQLVVLADPVRAAGGSGLDLAGVQR